MSRGTIATLSTTNLLHNLKTIKNAAPNSKIIAMVKANAYGHGLRSTALRLQKYVYSFGVASIDEALALRHVGIKNPITLMEGVFEQDEFIIAAHENFHVVFHDINQLEWLNKSKLKCKLTAWIKIDTGMGRLGFTYTEAMHVYKKFSCNSKIKQPIGLMSHFACADNVMHPLNQDQINKFKKLTHDRLGLKSFCNSAAIFSFRDQHYDVIRPGLALYGVTPLKNISASNLGLKPVMTLQTRLIAIKKFHKGSTLGYGAEFVCQNDMTIGVVAMGYGDGYPRSAQNGTPILVNNIRCQLVGRVSMDMMTIDLSNCPNAKVGDPVVLWGNKLPLEDVAPYTSQCTYDMLTAIQSRVKFNWID